MDTPNYIRLRSRVVPLSPAKETPAKWKMQKSKKSKACKECFKKKLDETVYADVESENDEAVIFVSDSRDPLEFIDLTEHEDQY